MLDANDNFLTLLGHTLDEVRGQHHSMFIDPAQRSNPEHRALWDKLGRGESAAAQIRRVGADGKEVWMHVSCSPMLDAAGNVLKVVEAGVDLSDARRELDEVRAELEVRTKIMNETSIVSEADLKGDILSINDKYIEISKYSKEELIGSPHNITRHPDMPKEVFKSLWGTIGRGNLFRGVIKNRAKDGTPYYVDAVIAPFMGKNGKPRKYLGVRYDITQAEIERQNMKGMLDALNKSFAVIEFDLKGNVLTANEAFQTTLGYTLEIRSASQSFITEPAYRSARISPVLGQARRGEYDRGIKAHRQGRARDLIRPVTTRSWMKWDDRSRS